MGVILTGILLYASVQVRYKLCLEVMVLLEVLMSGHMHVTIVLALWHY